MNSRQTFKSIQAKVESSYPTPIASVFLKCRLTREDDLGNRHVNLKDLIEVIIKFVCVLGFQDARNSTPNFRELLPQKEKTLEFIKKPSLGHWIGLLRILCSTEFTKVEPVFLSKIKDWYSQQKNAEASKALAQFSELGISYSKKAKYPNSEILNALVSYRNHKWGHGANLNKEEKNRQIIIIEQILVYLLKSMFFLEEVLLFHVKEVRATKDDGKWLLTVDKLTGHPVEPRDYSSESQFKIGEIFAAYDHEIYNSDTVFSMSPFLIWHKNSKNEYETYFHNNIKRTYLEYLSYRSGEYYQHPELHEAFKNIITLKPIDCRYGVDTCSDLSLEQRINLAEDHKKLAVMHEQDGRLEDALKEFETSIIYERNAEIFIKMAVLERQLGDPAESVLMTLQNCLDIEPGNDEAILLKEKLEKSEDKTANIGEKESISEKVPTMVNPTIYHALTPAPFRQYAFFWWVAMILSWYLPSAGVDWLAGHKKNLLPIALQCSLCFTLVLPLISVRPLIRRMRLPLSFQLDTMRLDRFNAWFDMQLDFIFGKYIFESGKLNILKSINIEYESFDKGKHNKNYSWYYWICIPWVAVLGLSAFFLAGYQYVNMFLIIKRLIDLSLIYLFLYFCVRYVVAYTLFVYEFSKLSLKPALTSINDEGMRSFGPLICFNIVTASVAYILHWTMSALVCEISYYFDFVFLGLNTAIMLVWSVGLPLVLRRAMRESKRKSIHVYAGHIEEAFSSFLEDPDEERKNRFEWLVKQQRLMKRISVWPLSIGETVLSIVAGNLIMILVNIWYMLKRTGQIEDVIKMILGGG